MNRKKYEVHWIDAATGDSRVRLTSPRQSALEVAKALRDLGQNNVRVLMLIDPPQDTSYAFAPKKDSD